MRLYNPSVDLKLLQEEITSPPKYDVRKRGRKKFTIEMENRLCEILEAEEKKNKTLGIHKQQLTKVQIHSILVNEGFDIGISTIRLEVNRLMKSVKECFIRQDYSFGDRLEYDFGEVKLEIDGKAGTYHMTVLSSPAGEFRWAYLYTNQKKEVFMIIFGNKENIIMIGTPRAGKTHYANGIGTKACLSGKTVLFVSVPNLIIELKEAMSLGALNTCKRKFEKYDLVILDELGYVSFDKSGCEILFNLLSNRNDKGSIIITTNLTFDRWEEIFKDPMLTGAMVDRLAHKAHILDISRDTSHRFEETIAWLKTSK